MSFNSENELCGLGLSRLGNNGSVGDITTPVTDIDIAFALFYNIERQFSLTKMMPNFALRRRLVAKDTSAYIAFGYAYAYEYPVDCLKVLGIGLISERENNYVIESDENGVRKIYTDEDYPDGLPLRFIYDETNVSRFTADFVVTFSYNLASAVAMHVTQNLDSAALAETMRKTAMLASGAINSQENRPVRVSTSRFKQSRYADITSYPTKK